MIQLPVDDPTSPIGLADWLEIQAILSADGNASRGDLESALRVAAFAELNDSDTIEHRSLEVLYELGQRAKAASEAYPFEVTDPEVIQIKSKWEDYPAYVFCLCLSYFGISATAPKLFEQISCIAAGGYIQGEAIAFGSPRTELPPPFLEAVAEVCKLIGEGESYQSLAFGSKDDTLDLIAYKDFSDKQPSKLIMFGQCAAGQNWEEKIGELHADVFLRQWISKLVSPVPVRCFFVPHRVHHSKWEFYARKAGVLFDRCRIAYWAHLASPNYSTHIDWVKRVFAQKLQ